MHLLFNPNLCYLLTAFSYYDTFYVILNTKGGVSLKGLKRNVFKAISALLLSTVAVSGVNIPFSSVVGANSTTAYAQSDDGYWDNFAKVRSLNIYGININKLKQNKVLVL